MADAFTVAFRPKPNNIKVDDPERPASYIVALVRLVEFLVYKVVLAVFLLALGNSNASVRQLLDTVRG
jgi:hypothetical protein